MRGLKLPTGRSAALAATPAIYQAGLQAVHGPPFTPQTLRFVPAMMHGPSRTPTQHPS